MNIVVILNENDHIKKCLKNKSLLEYTINIYQKIPQIDYFIICANEEVIDEIKYLKNEKTIICKNQKNKEETIANAIKLYASCNKTHDSDNIIIHEANYANTEIRIINDLLNKSKFFNCINTILPIENTFKIIKSNDCQLLLKNENEVYLIQSPQLFHYDVFQYLYLNGEKVDIKMINILGSKYNYDLSDELYLTLFKKQIE